MFQVFNPNVHLHSFRSWQVGENTLKLLQEKEKVNQAKLFPYFLIQFKQQT